MICECGDHINPGDDYKFVDGKYYCKICMNDQVVMPDCPDCKTSRKVSLMYVCERCGHHKPV